MLPIRLELDPDMIGTLSLGTGSYIIFPLALSLMLTQSKEFDSIPPAFQLGSGTVAVVPEQPHLACDLYSLPRRQERPLFLPKKLQAAGPETKVCRKVTDYSIPPWRVARLGPKTALENANQEAIKKTEFTPGMLDESNQQSFPLEALSAQLQAQANAVDSVAPAPPAPKTVQNNFFVRLGKAYWSDWTGQASSDEASKRRGYAAPVDGPPFPFSDWPYGGSLVLGAPWTQSGPLMQAIWSGSDGKAWKDSGIQIYGWFNFGGDISSSNRPGYSNLPTAYAERPNNIQPDQEVIYIERQPDTVQTDRFDWGFRVTGLYGLDYRFTTAKGIFSQQLLGRVNPDGSAGKEYGFDPVMVYLDFYLPHLGDGTDVRVGRYISLPDIEAQLAPNNYTYTHSLTYTYDCYTQTGVNATTKWGDHWKTQLGISAGCEAAPWTKPPDAKVTFNGCLIYEWNQGKDNIYPCLNALNSGKYAYNNLQALYFTWYHKFTKHPAWHTATEYWYMWENRVPNVNPAGAPAASAALLELNANGAWCKSPTEVTCFAPEHAVLNYLERQFGKHDYLSIRNEYFDDIRGQRTGFKDQYTEHTLGWGHWIGTTILFRPEVRYEHAYQVAAYDNGTKKTQLMFASDMIFFF